MRHTAKQTQHRTLTDLYRALDHQHAVTITYLDEKGEETVRTIEIFEIRTSAPVIDGDTITEGPLMVHAMCRLRNAQMKTDPSIRSAERQFDVSRIIAYTIHRMAYVLTRPEPTTYERPTPPPADDAQALFFYELARDRDDADYRPRVKLTQTDARLAA